MKRYSASFYYLVLLQVELCEVDPDEPGRSGPADVLVGADGELG